MRPSPNPRFKPLHALAGISLTLLLPGLAQGPVGYVPFEGGFNAQDGRPSTTVGSVSLNSSSTFNGSGGLSCSNNGYVQTGISGPSGNSPRSVGLWFRTSSSTGSSDALWGWGTTSTSGRYDLRLDGSNLRIEVEGAAHTFSLPFAANDRNWHHALLTYSGTTLAGHRLYLDGVFAGSATGSTTLNTGPASVRIGSGVQRSEGSNSTARDFAGAIDEFAVFNTELNAVQAAMLAGFGRLGQPPTVLPLANQLWNAPAGTRTDIGGAPWIRKSGLTGTQGRGYGTFPNVGTYVVVDTSGNGLAIAPPIRASRGDLDLLPAEPLSFQLAYGEAETVDLTLLNRDAVHEAHWKLVLEDFADDSLAARRTGVDAHAADLLATIPDRFAFVGGDSGQSVTDGGSNMYDGGNILRFDNSILSYANTGILTFQFPSAPYNKVRYFTRKLDGLFVFSAALDGKVSEFSIRGDLGADGKGEVSTESFTLPANGRLWRCLVQRIHGAGVPSINELVLVPDSRSIRRTALTTTTLEDHRVTGLSGTDTLHYLLFSNEDGRRADIATFRNLARAFLDSIATGQEWLTLPTSPMVTAPGGSAAITGRIGGETLAPGRYQTRVALSVDGDAPATLPESVWRPLILDVEAPAFTIDTADLSFRSVGGLDQGPFEIRIQPPNAAVTLTPNVPWLQIEPVPGQPGTYRVTARGSGLTAGDHFGAIVVDDGTSRRTLGVSIQSTSLNLASLVADPLRERLYAIQKKGKAAGSVMVIDIPTRQLLKEIPVGLEPTDLDLTEDSAELLVMNTSDPSISRIDLSSLEVTETIPLTEFSDQTEDLGGHVEDGPGDIIYYVDERWGARLRVFNTSTRTVLQTFSSEVAGTPNLSNNFGFGDIGVSPDQRLLFGWGQYGDNAGFGKSLIAGYDILPDGTLTGFRRSAFIETTSFKRQPFETPVLFSADSRSLVIKDRKVNPSQPDEFPQIHPSEVYAMTPGGESVSTESKLYPAAGGPSLVDLPAVARTQVITPDYSWLVRFSATTGSLDWTDLRSTPGLAALGVPPATPDGTRVALPARLAWEPTPGIGRYLVYLGTDEAEVTAAGPDSPLLLATSSTPFVPLNGPLTGGTQFFWKVAALTADGVTDLFVRSLEVAPLMVETTTIDRVAIAGVKSYPQEIRIESSDAPFGWTATEDSDWITLTRASGVSSESLGIDLTTAGLSPGIHRSTIRVAGADATVLIEVRLNVVPLDVTQLVSDPARATVYGFGQVDPLVGDDQLLFIDPADGALVTGLPIGRNARWISLHPAEDLLYVSPASGNVLQRVDPSTRTLLEPLTVNLTGLRSETVSRIVGFEAGRMAVLGAGAYNGFTIVRSSDGAPLGGAPTNQFYGGEVGAFDPLSMTYYHGRQGSSGDTFSAFDVSSNVPIKRATSPTTGFGGPAVLLSADGTKVFWEQGLYNTALERDVTFPEDVLAIDPAGDVMIGEKKIRWADGAGDIATLPTPSTIVALNPPSGRIVSFDKTGARIATTALADLVELPAPRPRPGQLIYGGVTRLEWPAVEGAQFYSVFLSGLPGGPVGWTGITDPFLVLPDGLVPGRYYTWRVTTQGPLGSVTGPEWTFGVALPENPNSLSSSSNVTDIEIGDSSFILGLGSQARIHDLVAFDRPELGPQSFIGSEILASQFSYTSIDFGKSVALDQGIAAIGAPRYDKPSSETGAFSEFQRMPNGAYALERNVISPLTVNGPRFGESLTADGGFLMVGRGSLASGSIGEVRTYLTRPGLVETQVLRADAPQADDGFGYRVALHGDTAMIIARPYTLSPTKTIAVHFFRYNATTGLWQHRQRLPYPVEITGSVTNIAQQVSIGRDLAAITDPQAGRVHLFERQPGDHWAFSRTLARTDDPAARSSAFGADVTVHDHTVFIGDIHATYGSGHSGGIVHVVSLESGAEIARPPIIPQFGSHSAFGKRLVAGQGRLLVAGESRVRSFALGPSFSRRPEFVSEPPVHAVSQVPFSTEIIASDADGDEGLVLRGTRLPAWLTLDDLGGGRALLHGTPTPGAGSTNDLRLEVSDPEGNHSFQSFRMTLLAATDIPVVTLQPTGRNLVAGQALELGVAAQGPGTLVYQWFRDGTAVPGATSPDYYVAEATLADTGSYTVEIRNVAGGVSTASAPVTIAEASRFAGPWPTFGGSPAHAGFHPAALGAHRFTSAWQTVVTAGKPLQRPAIAEGKVFTTPQASFGSGNRIGALALSTGTTLWERSIASSFSINPPTWHNGRVYFQRGKGTSDLFGPQLICLDAADGSDRWATVFGAQLESYEAPAVTDDGVWINGGASGGMYGYTPEGVQRFFRSAARYDGWTPSVSNRRLFSWVGGAFVEHDLFTGSPVWTLNLASWSNNTVAAISGDTALLKLSASLVCLDLRSRSVRWEQAGTFTGSPSIAAGVAYVIADSSVATFALADGTPGLTYPLPATIRSEQPLVTHDHLLAATNSATFVFRIGHPDAVQVLSGGGRLAYSDGYLLAAGPDGILRAFYANAAPTFATNLPPEVNADDEASDFSLQLGNFASDVESDGLTWAIVSVTRPEVFRTLEIDAASGDLTVAYNPWQWGSSDVTLSVTDSAGNVTGTTITFTVPNLPLPDIGLAVRLVLNRQTGLYEQTITVTNPALREIAGFDLTITGLPEGVCLNNASGCEGDTWIVQHRQPLAAGASVTLVLEYYAPVRGTVLDPQVAVSLVTIPETDPAVKDPGLAIDRCELLEDGLLVEFTSTPGLLYEIQYSDDATAWKVSPTRVRAAGNRTQWIDRGPPRTDSPPAEKSSRFYRVLEVTEASTE